jgi:hypothetical protein
VTDLRQALRNDPRFDAAAHDLYHLTERRRTVRLEEFWAGIYLDLLDQFQDEYLNIMGPRLAWHNQALDNLNQLEHPSTPKIVNTNPLSHRGESFKEVQGSRVPKSQRKDPFEDGT